MKQSNRRMAQVSFRLSKDLYDNLQKLKKALRVSDDSEAIRFCMVYTIAAMDKLDEKTFSEAFAIALGETFFSNAENGKTGVKKQRNP